MNKKSLRHYIIIALLLIITIANFCVFFFIINSDKQTYEHINSINLTEQEKIEDFEYLYNVIIEEYRNLYEYSEVFSINFKEKKQYYCSPK